MRHPAPWKKESEAIPTPPLFPLLPLRFSQRKCGFSNMCTTSAPAVYRSPVDPELVLSYLVRMALHISSMVAYSPQPPAPFLTDCPVG